MKRLKFIGKKLLYLLIMLIGVATLVFILTKLVPGDPVKTPIWNVYEGLAEQYDPRGKLAIGHLDRCTFYEKARRAYAVLATGETALYANLILQKGVVQNGPEAAGD